MRLQHVLVTRPDWFDRNPTAQSGGYVASSVAPHALTQRWTYTVATGKKAILQTAICIVQRDSVASVLGAQSSYMRYIPSGGSAVRPLYAYNTSNTLSAAQSNNIGATMALLAGDQIDGSTLDDSTGGTGFYLTSFQGIQFDA